MITQILWLIAWPVLIVGSWFVISKFVRKFDS